MKDYSHYRTVDFASDESFLRWVKYPRQYPDIDEFWKQWLHNNPQKKAEVDEARELIRAILTEKQYHPDHTRQREILERIVKEIDSVPAMGKQRPLWQQWYSIAAAILLLVACVFFLIPTKDTGGIAINQTENEQAFEERINNSDAPKTVILSDETSIVLQPESSLRYPKMFDEHVREVYIAGEAFFEVQKDPKRPFLVHTGEIVTRVLGTSFTVRSYPTEKNVLVRVKTGKVSVFKEKKQQNRQLPDENVEGVVLMPNQQVLYERDEMKMTKSLVENPTVLVPIAKEDFEFTDAPIKDVFRAIERSYGVTIVFDEEILSQCYLNASLSDVTLYEKLKLICKVIDATYEIMDSHIIIYGKGC